MIIYKNDETVPLALDLIYSIFLEPDVKISLRAIDKLAQVCRLFFIDKKGYLLGRYIHYEKA